MNGMSSSLRSVSTVGICQRVEFVRFSLARIRESLCGKSSRRRSLDVWSASFMMNKNCLEDMVCFEEISNVTE
jgi:hypothetical protein